MVAYFSSKFIKQIYAALAGAMLVACLLGTHWVGYAHSISHAAKDYQTRSLSNAQETDVTFSHSSDVCHLFDALSLAGFVPEALSEGLTKSAAILHLASHQQFHFIQTSALAYHSRAPPTPLL